MRSPRVFSPYLIFPFILTKPHKNRESLHVVVKMKMKEGEKKRDDGDQRAEKMLVRGEEGKRKK